MRDENGLTVPVLWAGRRSAQPPSLPGRRNLLRRRRPMPARSPARCRRDRPSWCDEFAVLMAGVTRTAAGVIAENMRNEFARSSAVAATVSIGVAELNSRDTPDQLLRRADERLYAAKQTRNAVAAS